MEIIVPKHKPIQVGSPIELESTYREIQEPFLEWCEHPTVTVEAVTAGGQRMLRLRWRIHANSKCELLIPADF